MEDSEHTMAEVGPDASPLTWQDMVHLRYMLAANGRGVGLFGPTVKRCGPLPELKRLVTAGLVMLKVGTCRNPDRGYWLTSSGLFALSNGERSAQPTG